MTIAMILAGIAAAGIGAGAAAAGSRILDVKRAYDQYEKAADKYGFNDVTVEQVIGTLYTQGELDKKDYDRALELIDQTHKDFETGDFKKGTKDFGYIFRTNKTYRQQKELYNLLASKLPELDARTRAIADELPDKIRESFYKNVPSIADAPAPNYLDTTFPIHQIEEEPAKLWTGQELADLHNITYDPNQYYDLIKEGTTAALDYGNFKGRQLDAAAARGDVKRATSYLDSIRNSKAEAIATGATLGQRLATDLLNNTNNMANYAQLQTEAATEKTQALDKLINADAQAKVTARNYFDKLANVFGSNSSQLYQNDSKRLAQDILSNAELYTADQNLRGAREIANANMYGAYVNAQAGINNIRAQANRQANEYRDFFDIAMKSNNNDVNKSLAETNEYIFRTYSHGKGYLDSINEQNRK